MTLKKIGQAIRLLLYYYGARYLPEHSMPQGWLWMKLRGWLCRPCFKHCGRDVQINRLAQFGWGNRLSIGDRSSLGFNARIIGDVTLGNDVLMAQDVFITSSNREFRRTDCTMISQGKRPDQPVLVHDDVLIFARAVILPGVTIHSGSVIGAASVVARDVPPNAVVTGNPARVVKFRVPPPPGADYHGMTPLSLKPADGDDA